MQAIILKKNIFSEGNEIVTMYTREAGKLRAVAKAVKSPKSKMAYALQTLFYTEVDVLSSRKLPTIKGVKPLQVFINIYGDQQKTALALYAAEIILKSTADEQPNETLFQLYLDLLKHLDADPANTHVCGDIFALKALSANGYALSYGKCSVCEQNLDIGRVFFSNRRGGFLCPNCAGGTSDAVQVSAKAYELLQQSEQLGFAEADVLAIQQNVDSKELHKLILSFTTHIIERNLNAAGYLSKL